MARLGIAYAISARRRRLRMRHTQSTGQFLPILRPAIAIPYGTIGSPRRAYGPTDEEYMEAPLQLTLSEQPDGTHQLTLQAPSAQHLLDAPALTNLIAGLAGIRAAMHPHVTLEIPPLEGMQGVADDPPFRIAYDEMNDRAALIIRHPGHGWVGYSLAIQSVEALQRGLQQITDHRIEQLRRPKN